MSRAALARVHAAHADAWEAEGRLRERDGGGALEVRGLRLMASGLAGAPRNGGDATAPDADLAAARAYYAARGTAWGVRVPSGMPWRAGRRLKTLRIMAVEPGAFVPAPAVPGVDLRPAGPGDLEAVLAVDAAAFGGDPAAERPWLAPHLGARRFTTVLATRDGEPVGTCLLYTSDAADDSRV